jgi:hypothetical protein
MSLFEKYVSVPKYPTIPFLIPKKPSLITKP